jgi:hypothetical protein
MSLSDYFSTIIATDASKIQIINAEKKQNITYQVLKLRGYNIFRFGGHELSNNGSYTLVKGFVKKLFKNYTIEPVQNKT